MKGEHHGKYDEWDYQFTPIKGHYLPHKYRVDRRINHYEHGVYDSERIGDLIVLMDMMGRSSGSSYFLMRIPIGVFTPFHGY